jgi:hypothetical protein
MILNKQTLDAPQATTFGTSKKQQTQTQIALVKAMRGDLQAMVLMPASSMAKIMDDGDQVARRVLGDLR